MAQGVDIKKRRLAGYLAGFIAGVSYGTNPLFAKPLLESGVPVATINGNNLGTVIEAKSPLVLKNVKITGGKADGTGSQGYGGGIYASGNNITVTLDSGVLVTGNKAK